MILTRRLSHKGRCKTSIPNIILLKEQIKREIRLFEKFSIAHIPGEKNQEEDALADIAMGEAVKITPS
jgi:hypothetical protein